LLTCRICRAGPAEANAALHGDYAFNKVKGARRLQSKCARMRICKQSAAWVRTCIELDGNVSSVNSAHVDRRIAVVVAVAAADAAAMVMNISATSPSAHQFASRQSAW